MVKKAKKSKAKPKKVKKTAPQTPKPDLKAKLTGYTTNLGTIFLEKLKRLWREFVHEIKFLPTRIQDLIRGVAREVARFAWSAFQLPLDVVRLYRWVWVSIVGLRRQRESEAIREARETKELNISICDKCGASNAKSYVSEYRVNVVRGAEDFPIPKEPFEKPNFALDAVTVSVDGSKYVEGEDFVIENKIVHLKNRIGIPKSILLLSWCQKKLGRRPKADFRDAVVTVRLDGRVRKKK